MIDAADEIHAVSDAGIRAMAESLRWGGAAFHNAGWNPRHIEGAEHFVFYNLEYVTGKHFLHGQPVTLGVLLMSDLQGNDPERIRAIADRIGVRYRPEEMGVDLGRRRRGAADTQAVRREGGPLVHGRQRAADQRGLDRPDARLARRLTRDDPGQPVRLSPVDRPARCP